MKLNRILYITLGYISFGLGVLGAFLPILPTVPFLLLSAFCFSKGSQKIHSWLVSTKLYKNNIEALVKGEGMTLKAKITAMITITALLTISFILMGEILIGRIVLLIIWLCHFVYFNFRVKTIK